ncbi:MAG: DUF3488 domain-containing protein [Solirubrobacterales bacterium]
MNLEPIRSWLRKVDWPWDALLVLLAAGVVVSLVFGWTEAAGLFAGTLFAAALILRFPPAVAAAEPLGGFLRGLRPLILPLVIVLIAGTVAYSWLVPLLAVPALLVAGWYLLVAPEIGPTGEALSETKAWLRKGLHGWGHIVAAVALVLGIAAIVFVVIGLSPDVALYESRPEVSNAAITVALVAWMAAAVLRLGGFATSWFRAVVALISVLALVRVLMVAGLLPGHNWLIRHAAWLSAGHLLLLTAIGLAVIVLADAIISLIPRLHFLPGWGAFPIGLGRTLRGLGFAAAVLAAVALGAAAFYGVISSEANGREGITPRDEVIAGKVRSPRGLTLHQLAEQYQPVLVMTDAEKWAPVTVDSYLQDQNHPAFMIRPNGKRQRAPSLANLPRTGDCHGARPPCFQITIDCPSGSEDCAEGQPDRTDQGETIPDYRDGADYARIITRDEPGGSPQAFDGTGPYGKNLRTLIQYWYFYRYDEWTRPVLGGRLVQRHEGDWEAVTIGFSAKAPLFVGYSAHCGGSWVPWNKAELADTGPPRVHPLVAVAEGSHANYTRAQDRRAPDWAGCQGVPAGTTTVLSYAANIRDETSYGWDWLPARTIFVNNLKPPMTFPGSWGGNDYTELINERDQRLSGAGKGPLNPPLQPLWYDPVHQIFCSKHWHGPEPCTR